MTEQSRGSEWRKWDLHIHTPGSFYFKSGINYLNINYNEKIIEYEKFLKAVNESDIAVFCIMDYWNFDWYIDLMDYVKINPDKLKKTIFPGMELRIESPTSFRLNIHCILSNNLTIQNLQDFKSELIIRSIDKKLSNEAIISFAKTLDESKAKHHSFQDPATLTDEKLLELGSRTIEVTKESLTKALNQIPENQGFILLPYDTSDGLSELKWEKHPHADNYFMQSAHIFEAREQASIDLITGIRTDENKSFFDNFFKTLGNKSKPCISGSDAHKYSDYGKYPSNKITWIKADTTFEGLKQIIYEPEQRVKIQKEEPDFKEDKLIIDEVKFHNTNDNFTTKSIKFNKNLNVIIGGKSSGKSILLYCIAKTLLADKKILINEGIDEKYNFLKTDNPNFNFEVKSKGNISQFLYSNEDERGLMPDIKYIPQNYLISLAEPKKNKKDYELLEVVRSLIREDRESNDIYVAFEDCLKQNDKKRNLIIDNYFDLKERKKVLEKDLSLKSNKKVLEQSIKTNSIRIEELNRSIGLSEQQILEYKVLQEKAESLELKKNKLRNDFKTIALLNGEVLSALNDVVTKKRLRINAIETEEVKTKVASEYEKLDYLLESVKLFCSSFEMEKNNEGINKFKKSNLLTELHFGLNEEALEIDKKLAPFNNNEETKNQISLIELSINEDKSTLSDILNIRKQIEEIDVIIKKEKESLFNLFEVNYNEYPKVISKLSERLEDLQKDNLVIKGVTKFNYSKLRKDIISISNNTKSSYKKFPKLFSEDKNADTEFNLDELKNEIKQVFESIADNEEYSLLTKSNFKEAAKILLYDYFFDAWEIEYKGDKLGKMSTGKASFVILMLIVGLSKSKSPILIDQPEDNLDNRSISNELVTYLKNKKLERQVILVTHNANIVVNADSENVIVSNQKGQSDLETKSPYKFDYINGALENTFEYNEKEKDILKSMGIREHIAEIVEGGKEAFKKREEKYGF